MTLSPLAGHLRIPGTFNFRDLGGLPTAGGGTIRPGVLLRSAQLSSLDETGHAVLRELGVRAVHDLRGQPEIAKHGADRLPDGIRLMVTPFDSDMGEAPPHDPATGAAKAHMIEVYRMFPARPEAHAAILALAESVVRGDGAVLVHCAAGKDRTGWAIATLLRAVGVDEPDVLADYLLSNSAVPVLKAMLIENLGPDHVFSDDLLGVREEYLRSGLDSVRELHGDIDRYLDAVGLTAELRARLRERLVG
ncbi:tyrosine-protein phosphatase [Nocardia cyriacigeorgica]|uniref:tyrosine-protein phosphatase n=1 Tax=Nocardia cyriacigeorgica TaxID=135487 RepID=UPI001894B366|nr:tyrosine-protein phosphatase [Nocardia cyriacigeorgica]MBF6436691.1 tyrosine-protein phosphatase [Nocardia cyriacigeorgica]MBF6452260.1 tyrosine-protein phosphatase [Nocardia cyriacigeorgica]MBF6479987.1 tyrosine-protein phosphatase [Nocardia cyriacigeorgica]MBF6549429.1 tyrosine-protein phosphatase [Nocardia cyriacigeorgica]